MELVVVTEHDPIATMLPFGYQTTFRKPTHIEVVLTKWGVVAGKERVKYDLSQAQATLDGSPLDLLSYLNAWVAATIEEFMLTFPSGTLADGIYKQECAAERTFDEDCLIVNGVMMKSARVTVEFDIYFGSPRRQIPLRDRQTRPRHLL